ncbi:capsid portal protein [Paracidovorax wautersii]|uniref:Capsid portal protein n=1 Tax=Paracidovorax wautersii TaxID=1177982 RepID=A0ABU1ICD3_9BURK|nr:capsid portal protein [Paracidovorax wautersii]
MAADDSVATAARTGTVAPGVRAFSFGDPEPVMRRGEIADYIECWLKGRWYEPPISWEGLSRSFRASPHHASALQVKRNVLASTFIPHKLLDRATFGKFALDHLVYGNGYLERPLPGSAV